MGKWAILIRTDQIKLKSFKVSMNSQEEIEFQPSQNVLVLITMCLAPIMIQNRLAHVKRKKQSK